MATRKSKSTRKARASAKQSAAETKPDQPGEGEHADFFSALGAGLKAAGQAASRYTRMGVRMAELEKLRMELRAAYARLGEQVCKCWDDAPSVGVVGADPALKAQWGAVLDLRRRIREAQATIATLKTSE